MSTERRTLVTFGDGSVESEWRNEPRTRLGRLEFKDGTFAEAVCAARCAASGRFIAWVYDNPDPEKGPLGLIVVVLREVTVDEPLRRFTQNGNDGSVHWDRRARPIPLDPSSEPAEAYCSPCRATHTIDPIALRTAIANQRHTIRV